tara:strand:- start:349 stop:564 length:216 start_codon:yes stop_codon:yes gene_type:complete
MDIKKQRQQLKNKRLKICKGCKYVKETKFLGLTCGDFGIPTIFEDGSDRTCGCSLSLKTYIFDENCPQNKW